MEKLNISEFYSRNYPFISIETQQKLAELRVALIGTGLSSQVAESLVRLGVKKFKIWDNDTIAQSNLNRQAFNLADTGLNKAKTTARNMLQINNTIEVIANTNHFVKEDLAYSLNDIDIAINSADFATDLVYDINDYMQINKKWCIQPLNLGFGGMCIIFGPQSPSLEKMTSGRQKETIHFIKNLLSSAIGFKPGRELLENGDKLIIEGAQSGWFPQNIIATLITTSLISWALVKICEGDGHSIAAPAVLHFEPDFANNFAPA